MAITSKIIRDRRVRNRKRKLAHLQQLRREAFNKNLSVRDLHRLNNREA